MELQTKVLQVGDREQAGQLTRIRQAVAVVLVLPVAMAFRLAFRVLVGLVFRVLFLVLLFTGQAVVVVDFMPLAVLVALAALVAVVLAMEMAPDLMEPPTPVAVAVVEL